MGILKQIRALITSFTRNLELKQKFILLYLVGIFIPVIIVDSIAIFHIKAYQDREAQLDLQNSVERVLREFSSVTEQVTYFSRNIVSDSSLTEFLDTDYTSEDECQDSFLDIRDKSVLNYFKFIKEVSDITIYVDNDTILKNDRIKPLDDMVRKMWWYQKFIGSKSPVYIFEDITRDAGSGINPHAGVITLVRKFPLESERECILVMDLNYNQLNHAVIGDYTRTDLYICNNNRILFASDSKIFKKDKTKLPVVEQINREKVVVSRMISLVGEKWKVYALRNRESFLSTLFSSRELLLGMLGINLLLPTLMINILVKSVVMRLNVLDQHFEGLNNERFDKIEDDSRKDEISQLFRHYNGCVDKIQELINTIVEKNDEKHALEATKKQAELNALNTQVNPHFMYNTLECICMRSVLKGEKETAEIVRCLSVLLRQMSKWDRDVVPIEEELSFVEKYLSIQKYRYAEKIAYEVRVEDSAKDFIIPKLTLVSFVENACVHGIEESIDSGDVSVTARTEDDHIKIVVKDTGCGMDEETLNKLREKIKIADVNMLYHSKSTGVLNAVMRLKMYFGDKLSFVITSVVDEGTRIEISIDANFK